MSQQHVDQLCALVAKARYFPGERPVPPAHGAIGGRAFEVRFLEVKRCCYDGLATPTAMFKLDGRRVSRAAAFQVARDFK